MSRAGGLLACRRYAAILSIMLIPRGPAPTIAIEARGEVLAALAPRGGVEDMDIIARLSFGFTGEVLV